MQRLPTRGLAKQDAANIGNTGFAPAAIAAALAVPARYVALAAAAAASVPAVAAAVMADDASADIPATEFALGFSLQSARMCPQCRKYCSSVSRPT